MGLHLGDKAPDFTAETQLGEINFLEWKGDSWAMLFSHPADFTPVCTTEMGRFAELTPEFEERGFKLIGLSVDTVDEHKKWIVDIEKFKNGTKLTYPIIADADKKVAELYDMIHPAQGDTSSVRAVYVIDPKNVLRLILMYPKSTGRNFDELLRVVDALQKADSDGVATGADWRPGDKAIVPPTIPTAEALEKFNDVDVVYEYLRFTSGRK